MSRLHRAKDCKEKLMMKIVHENSYQRRVNIFCIRSYFVVFISVIFHALFQETFVSMSPNVSQSTDCNFKRKMKSRISPVVAHKRTDDV